MHFKLRRHCYYWSSTFLLMSKLLLYLMCGFKFIDFANTELYTALAEMEELLETEAVLISNLQGFIKVQEDRLDYLRGKLQEYQREHTEAANDISAYLENPINAYLLTKRLTTDWKQVESLMAYDVEEAFLGNISNYRKILKFPSDEDLNGAAVALMRLQDTYDLDTASVAKGQLNGVQYSTQMSSEDCFELGRQSYVNDDHYHTILWMQEAMSRLDVESNNKTRTFSKADVLDYLAFSNYKEGYLKSALSITNELLQLIPDHERAIGNKHFFEKELRELSIKQRQVKGDDGKVDIPLSDLLIAKNEADISYYPEQKSYELLCQGKMQTKLSQIKELRCRYVTNNVPFLKIGPLKLEEAYKDPMIVIYHDAMYDSEIEFIKKMARPRFRRATVQNSITGEFETANYRISKSAWLKTEEHPVIRRVVQRTEDMTGLDMISAEELQVVNYGIGGHYEPHFDFAKREDVKAFHGLNTGNRIATVLFYMSDVEQGGATVFTFLKTAIKPKKGTAAFWYNLHRSGEGDSRTRHAACPVLTGSKWVSNKWIHEQRQEFRRPCALKPDHGKFAI